jgi:hypothetical protein
VNNRDASKVHDSDEAIEEAVPTLMEVSHLPAGLVCFISRSICSCGAI